MEEPSLLVAGSDVQLEGTNSPVPEPVGLGRDGFPPKRLGLVKYVHL